MKTQPSELIANLEDARAALDRIDLNDEAGPRPTDEEIDEAAALARVAVAEATHEAKAMPHDIKAAIEWLERALDRDWYLGDERAEAREDVKTALTLLKNWLGAKA